MANTFKKVIDQLSWRQVAPAPNAHAAAVCVASDLRSGMSRNPFVYQLASAAILNRFNVVTKAWNFVQSPALAGTYGIGAAMAFVPSLGLVGTIAAGATTTRVTISTAFPTAVGINMLANRGGSGEYGFKIRIIDTTAGKTEERYIVGNSAGTQPVIDVLSAFSFTPATGARYEIVAGRVFMLSASTLVSNIWRSLEIASNTLSSGLSTTNLPASIGTDSSIMVLDEQYTPYNCMPGEGMVLGAFVYDTGVETRKALAATASGASTLTGQASLGDAVVAGNEYRNFQIRIVQDLTTPTAVGQRRIIASHGAGPSAVYTLATAWTVQPSSSAKFVIELPNLLLLRSSATTSVYTWNYGDATVNNGTASIASNAWHATYFGVAPAAHALGGQWAPSWGIQPDVGRNARHSHCHWFRGGGAVVDTLDIAAAIAGTWTATIAIDGAVSLTTGTSGAYSPFDNEGRMFYMNIYAGSAINQIYRFDVKNRVLSPFTPTDFLQSGTAAGGNRMAAYCAVDGTAIYDCVLLLSHASTIAQEMIPLV
jgi:hypothetical protein